jgi:hypothetical protein
MKRAALVLVLVTAVSGCTFGQKHPGITVGLVAGTMGFGTCGLAVDRFTTCAAVGGIAGLAIGGITGLVTTFFDTGGHELPQDPEDAPIRRVKSKGEPEGPYLPPEPNPLPQTATPEERGSATTPAPPPTPPTHDATPPTPAPTPVAPTPPPPQTTP